MKELIKRVSSLVDAEIEIKFRDDDCYGDMPDYENCKDSFGEFTLTGHCEPEDAIWCRDLQDNYYTGLMLGIRNTLKALKDNPDIMEELINE